MSAPPPTPPPVRDAEILRQFLAGRDVRCTACGFNLRDLDAGTCPKCSARLAISIRPSHIRPFAWTVALIGYSFVLMACSPLLVIRVISVSSGGGASVTPSEIWLLSAGLLAMSMLALLLLLPYAFYRLPWIVRAVLALLPPAAVLAILFASL